MHFRYLFYFLCLFPAFLFRDYTPTNELKYISIVEEALQNHTWFTFYNHGQIYADKPPLYFWLIMAARLITGEYYFGLMGLFSLLPALGILVIMDKWMSKFNIKHDPFVSNLLLLTTGIFLGSLLVLRMDMLMAFFITYALSIFFRMYEGRISRFDTVLFPVLIFLAVFTKGAMGFLIPFVSGVVFLFIKKRMKSFSLFFGLKFWLSLCSLLCIWFICIYLEGGKEYLSDILFRQTIERGVNSFHHKQPFYYYMVRVFMTFAPWIFLYIVVIGKIFKERVRLQDTELFFLVIVVSCFCLLSLISSKLDIYLLPVYPFVVYLVSCMLYRFSSGKLVKVSIIIPCILFISFFFATFFLKEFVPDYLPVSLFRLSLLFVCFFAIAGLYYMYINKLFYTIKLLCIGILSMICVFSFGFQSVNPYIGYGTLAKDAQAAANLIEIHQYGSYKLKAASNMDGYLRFPVKEIGSLEMLYSWIEEEGSCIVFTPYSVFLDQIMDSFPDVISYRQIGFNVWFIAGRQD